MYSNGVRTLCCLSPTRVVRPSMSVTLNGHPCRYARLHCQYWLAVPSYPLIRRTEILSSWWTGERASALVSQLERRLQRENAKRTLSTCGTDWRERGYSGSLTFALLSSYSKNNACNIASGQFKSRVGVAGGSHLCRGRNCANPIRLLRRSWMLHLILWQLHHGCALNRVSAVITSVYFASMIIVRCADSSDIAIAGSLTRYGRWPRLF